MAMTFECDPPRRRCTIRLTGVITLHDLKDGIRTQVDAGTWTWDTLIDTTDATGIETTSADIRRVTHTIAGEVDANILPARGPVVIVVTDRGSRIYELARRYQVIATNTVGLRIEVVRAVDDADDAFERLRMQLPAGDALNVTPPGRRGPTGQDRA